MSDLNIEYLLCCGIASLTCPECKQEIKATTDEIFSEETPFVCPHCSARIDVDQEEA